MIRAFAYAAIATTTVALVGLFLPVSFSGADYPMLAGLLAVAYWCGATDK